MLSDYGYPSKFSVTKDRVKKEYRMIQTPCCDIWGNENQADIKTIQRRRLLFGKMKAKLASKNSFWKWISRTEGENGEMGISNSRERSRLNEWGLIYFQKWQLEWKYVIFLTAIIKLFSCNSYTAIKYITFSEI